MADVKISALPAATTPLAGTEVLPIVQSATTKQVAVSDLTAGRAMSASSLTLTTPLSVANGGTGLTSLTAGYIPYATAANTLGTSANLQFDGSILTIVGASTNAITLKSASGAASGFKIYNDSAVDTAYLMNNYSGPMVFGTANAERMRLDASGNLLVGTTTANGLLTVAGTINGAIVQRKGTYTAGATTPSVAGITYLSISNSSATTITNFTNGVDGQIIYLYFNDANTTITRSNAYLAGGSDFVSTAFDTLVLMNIAGTWAEISRSANS